MRNIEERLNPIFANKDFLEKNGDCNSFDAIYDAVLIEDSTITRDELGIYLDKLSEEMNKDELNLSDLETVSGGVIDWVVLGTAAGIVWGVYEIGKEIGKYIKARK